MPIGEGDGRRTIGPKLPGDWYEVEVPDAVREHSVVAAPGAAAVSPPTSVATTDRTGVLGVS